MLACIVDVETTGPEPADQIIEIGSYLMEAGEAVPHSPFHCLVAPTCPIPPTASAVHHLTDEDVANAAPWAHISAAWFAKVCEANVVVAHNASFEQMHLAELLSPRAWVCTYKCALRAWPDAPAFGNQALRYWRKPRGLDRRLASESHRALPDAYVTAFLFAELLREHSIETLIEWSAEIPMPARFGFGKHKGEFWADAPFDYLEWIAFKSEMDQDTKAYAEHWLGRRRLPKPRRQEPIEADPRATPYLKLAAPVIAMCHCPNDLTEWWRREVEVRADYGLISGTPAYDELVAMCAARN